MSGRKNVIRNILFTAGDLSGDLSSAPQNCTGLDNICIQLVVSGGTTPTGTFSVWMTNDAGQVSPPPTVSSSWSELVFDTSPTLSATPDDLILNIREWPGTWIQLRYTSVSGSGNLKATMTAKQVGG